MQSMMSQVPLGDQPYWFPGRWIGGISLIMGPVLLLAGSLLRIRFDFFFPAQLQAYHEHPELLKLSYSLFLAGNVLLWPATLTMTRIIGLQRPGWALWAGTFVMFGLFARTFHAGIDHLAFLLVPALGLDKAKDVISNSYGAYHIMSAFNATIFFGWILLAIGAFKSKTLGLIRSICLGLMSILMMGVLKGTSITSLVALIGLSIAFIPLGVKVLETGPRPSGRLISKWIVIVIGLLLILAYSGQLG